MLAFCRARMESCTEPLFMVEPPKDLFILLATSFSQSSPTREAMSEVYVIKMNK